MTDRRPHIVYVLSDQHCGRALGCAGDVNLAGHTPELDRLCAEGAGFRRAYANCPVCTPSRGTIFSGRHAHAGAVQHFFDVFKPAAPSTATLLGDAGYRCAYIGKWHCGTVRDQRHRLLKEQPERFPFDRAEWPRTPEHLRGGFADWQAYECNNSHSTSSYYVDHEALPRELKGYNTDALTQLAIDSLAAHDADRPLFLVLSPEPPHFPLDVPPEWLARFDPDALRLPPWFDDLDGRRRHLAIYYAMIANLDWNIGRLRRAIEATPGLAGNTILVYTSDHGDFMGSHREFWVKGHPHEPSVLVPAIFHGPGVRPQGMRDGLFSLVDLLATTCGLAGLPVPSWSQGFDWSGALGGADVAGPREVLLEMHGTLRSCMESVDHRSFTDGRWKYGFYETGDEILFDLERDPWERDDLAQREAFRLPEMRRRLKALLAATREPYWDVLIDAGRRWQGEVVHVGTHHASLSPIWRHVRRAGD